MKRIARAADPVAGCRLELRSAALRIGWRSGAIALLLAVSAVASAEPAAPGAAHSGHALGKVDFPVSCAPDARERFNQAMLLLHHMTYPQAREAFARLADTAPDCAMAHWGIAMTLFQPLWPTRPSPAALQRGWEAVEKAKALAPPTERERLFVAAAEAFFRDPAGTDYWLRIRRWEEAMGKLHAQLPDDPEAAAFYALAHLATAPANVISRDHSDRAAEILMRVYEGNPEHPGAMHYLIHANDVPGRERESIEITRKYEATAPRNPHALHMPTHIHTRVGDWDAVIRGNLKAAEAALEHPAGERGELVWDEFPHAIEYLVYAHLQQGEDEKAAQQLRRLRGTANLEPTFKTAFHLASTQARYALERRDWAAAAAIRPGEPAALEWKRFTWPEAIARFAQGLGALRTEREAEARGAVARLAELEQTTRTSGEDLFARNIQVLRLELEAWLAQHAGDAKTAAALMGEAAALESATPKHAVTPGPTLPAHEQLGDLLMQQEQPSNALAAYRRALELYPKRLNGLLGAARAANAAGDKAQARVHYEALLQVAGRGQRKDAVAEARAYLARAGE